MTAPGRADKPGAGAPGLRKKSALERQQDALDEIAQIRKDVDNRFTFETPDIAKRYVEGRLKICLKLRSGRGGEEIECFFGRTRANIFEHHASGVVDAGKACNGVHNRHPIHTPRSAKASQPDIVGVAGPIFVFQALPGSGAEHQGEPVPNREIAGFSAGAEIYRHKPHPVFVAAVSGMQQPQERVASVVRLQIPNHLDSVGGKLFLFSKGGFKFTEIQAEGEFDVAFASFGYPNDDLAKHLVEGRPKVMEDFPALTDKS